MIRKKNDCLPQFQSAYRQYHSVETYLCKVYNGLVCNGIGLIDLVLLDFNADYHTLDHDTLLRDLKNLGVHVELLKRFI